MNSALARFGVAFRHAVLVSGAAPLVTLEARRLRQDLEAERAGDRRRLDESNARRIAEPINRAGAIADEGVLGRLVAEILAPERRRGDETRSACFGERDEEA